MQDATFKIEQTKNNGSGAAGKTGPSEKNNWRTPRSLFDTLDRIYGFDLDAAADYQNHLCDRFFTAETDGLGRSWDEDSLEESIFEPFLGPSSVWINPPYSETRVETKGGETKEITSRVWHKWVEKAISEVEAGNVRRVGMLIPAAIETAVWQNEIWPKASLVLLFSGRVRFVDPETGSPKGSPAFPSAFVLFGDSTILQDDEETLQSLGTVVQAWNGPKASQEGGQ